MKHGTSTRIRVGSFLALSLALALSACSDGPAGIFYRVATETDINLNKTKALESASPSFVARLGDTSYLGAGYLWTKKDGDKNWTQTTNGTVAGVSDKPVYASSGVSANDKLYVIFKDAGSGADLGVFTKSDGSAWGAVTIDGLVSGESLSRLLSANGEVFLSTHRIAESKDQYRLFRLGGSAFSAMTINSSIRIGPPSSVAFLGTDYWFAAGGLLLKGDVSTLAHQAGPTGLDWKAETTARVTTYGGVCAVDGAVVVASRSGILYRSADGGATWVESEKQASAAGTAYSFTIPTYLAIGESKLVLVGTDATPRSSTDLPVSYGYLQYAAAAFLIAGAKPDTTHATLSDPTNYSSTLSSKIVTAMPLVDQGSGAYKLYALTMGDGLWSNSYSGSAWGKWVRE